MLDHIIRYLKFIYSVVPTVKYLEQTITKSSFYLNLTKKRITQQIKIQKYNVLIETTNLCNARCLMCPHKDLQRPLNVMSDKVFEKIIQRLREEQLPINKIILSGFGEPLTDRSFIKRLQKIKELGYFVKFYTNASLLTEKISRKIVELGIEEINISFNGTAPVEYKKIMGLDFKKTLKNINKLLVIKKQLKSKYPIIRISMILIKENKKSIKKHLKNWQDKVDSVTVSIAHSWGEIINEKKERLTYPCRSLWHTYSIDVNGDFTICCRDYESKFILGNIMKNSFKDIQNNKILKQFREKHLFFKEKELPIICRGCNFPYQGGVEWWLPRSID